MLVKSGYRSIIGDYVFAKTDERVRAFKKNNPKIKVIDLGVGDVKLPIPKSIARKMKKSAYDLSRTETFSGYPPDYGFLPLRKAICEYYKTLGCEVEIDEVFITAGAKPALADLASLAEFDCAFLPVPSYPLYAELCAAYKIKTAFFGGVESDYVKKAKENNCDICFICSPCNPTGEKLGYKSFIDLCEYEDARGGVIILDAAYAFFDDEYTPPFVTKAACSTVCEVRTFSKSLSFTGVRCGFTVIKKQNPLYGAFKKLLSLKYNGVNITAQRAALAAFSYNMAAEFYARREYYRKNAEVLAAPFVKRGYGFSGGVYAPYIFVNVGVSGERFALDLLEKSAVCVTPGEGFGAENSIRISCLCTSDAADEGALRIGDFLDRYGKEAIVEQTHKRDETSQTEKSNRQ